MAGTQPQRSTSRRREARRPSAASLPSTLAPIVSAHAIRTPHKVAIDDGVRRYTFLELETFARQAAAGLAAAGVRKGDRVAVIADKCCEIVIWAIGIWKLGAIYAPVDPTLPRLRLDNYLERTRPAALIAEPARLDVLNGVVERSFSFAAFRDWSAADVADGDAVSPDDVAVIIHTSGSTGIPKGVQLQHGSVVAYFRGHQPVLGLTAESRCLNTASFHYDVSIQDTFQALYFGAYVYLCRQMFLPQVVLPLIQQQRFTHMTAVATILALITGDYENLDRFDLSTVKVISTGAELTPVKLIGAWLRKCRGLRVLNGYAPSEVNSVAVSYVIDAEEPDRVAYYPIGKPHANVEWLLVDADMRQIESANTRGQLLLGGPQLMKGYWGDDEATHRAFHIVEGNRFYKTGDLCHLDDNGDLVFDGRMDFEVKIRGRRMNLNEIREIVLRFASYSDAVVGVVGTDEGKEIALLVGASTPHEWATFESLRALLRKHLPDYMVPAVFGVFRERALTTSGKLNEKELIARLNEAVDRKRSDFYAIDENGGFNPVQSCST